MTFAPARNAPSLARRRVELSLMATVDKAELHIHPGSSCAIRLTILGQKIETDYVSNAEELASQTIRFVGIIASELLNSSVGIPVKITVISHRKTGPPATLAKCVTTTKYLLDDT
eukprot:gene17747-22753_t